MRVFAVAATLLAVAAGCGSVESAPSGDREATPTTTEPDHARALLSFEKGGGSVSVMWLLEEEPERVSVKKRYGVFRRSPTQRESELARRVAEDFSCSVALENDESEEHGEPVSDLTRILLSEIGPKGYDLVAQPTTVDTVSIGLFPGGGGSCGASPPEGFTLSAELADNRTAIVYGIVPDGVEAVDLVIDGRRHSARFGENGYALEIPDAPGKVLETMLLRHADGSITTVPETG